MTEYGPSVNLAAYKNLMVVLDMKNRWVYKGSVTTPPHSRKVNWNVLSIIYPIKAKNLAMFNALLESGKTEKHDTCGDYIQI
jgi:carbonic anhydrase